MMIDVTVTTLLKAQKRKRESRRKTGSFDLCWYQYDWLCNFQNLPEGSLFENNP